jgi:hypothetical protein
MYGDALDLANNSLSQEQWQAMFDAAQLANADFIENLGADNDPGDNVFSGFDHVHADWRNH